MENLENEKQANNKTSYEANRLIRVINSFIIFLTVIFIIIGFIIFLGMIINFNGSFVSIENINIKTILFLIIYMFSCYGVILNLEFKMLLLKNLNEIYKKINSN